MSVFNDIEFSKKGNSETCLHNAKKNSSQDNGASWARVTKYAVERKFQRTSRKMRYCRIADG